MAHTDREVHIVMAAYCEDAAVGETVRGLRTRYSNVIVVDDGSPDQTATEALEAGAMVLRHVVNRGQGAALQTGIDHALQMGARYIVTFDADGQHSVADIPLLLEPLRSGRCDVVLGSRFLRSAQIPTPRKLVLKAGVIFTRIVSGIRVTDTHNGLRAFTREAAERIEIRLDRMAHASELLDQIGRSDLRWIEVPVEVRYTDYSKRKGQSSLAGFRIAWDFLIGRLK
ncbi:MAG: glycosyltransferase family 2 protein [Thermoanaerobaculia bacterium]